jgi:hypothetical protein
MNHSKWFYFLFLIFYLLMPSTRMSLSTVEGLVFITTRSHRGTQGGVLLAFCSIDLGMELAQVMGCEKKFTGTSVSTLIPAVICDFYHTGSSGDYNELGGAWPPRPTKCGPLAGLQSSSFFFFSSNFRSTKLFPAETDFVEQIVSASVAHFCSCSVRISLYQTRRDGCAH